MLANGEMQGRVPTFREIGAALEISSTNGVNDHLGALVRKGLVDMSGIRRRANAVKVTEAGWAALRLRECGHCAGMGMVRA